MYTRCMVHFRIYFPWKWSILRKNCILQFLRIFECSLDSSYSLWFTSELANFRYTREIFKVDFLENETSNETTLWQNFVLFSHVESVPIHLFYDYSLALYNAENNFFQD